MRIGIVGAGFAGRALARLAVRNGCDVMLSNSLDPATLPTTMLMCKVGTNAEAATFGEVVVIFVAFPDHRDLAPSALAGKVIIDATDYLPQRDGPVAELDDGRTTSSEMLAAHFQGADVVKALNAIEELELERDARPSGAGMRRALPIAGDSGHAKQTVTTLLDLLGFDVVDAGPLSEGWRFAPEQPAYRVPLVTIGLQDALAEAMRPGETVVTA